ncbi:MAG: metalloregulator ArsR/SmtB family transcription factor [Clostridia bacterium]|nr:metalloregulator ArsR/SmtB family transcription factor [Clostridia bacterium]
MKKHECKELMTSNSHIVHNIPNVESITNLAELFKIFGDATRIKIIYCIYEKKMNVCEIATSIHMTHSSVSHQLKNLRQARLVKAEKEGKEVYYSLCDEHIEKIFSLGLEHIKEM